MSGQGCPKTCATCNTYSQPNPTNPPPPLGMCRIDGRAVRAGETRTCESVDACNACSCTCQQDGRVQRSCTEKYCGEQKKKVVVVGREGEGVARWANGGKKIKNGRTTFGKPVPVFFFPLKFRLRPVSLPGSGDLGGGDRPGLRRLQEVQPHLRQVRSRSSFHPPHPLPDQRRHAKMEAQLEHVPRRIHVFACLAPICVLSRCFVAKFLHRSPGGSLLTVRCWSGMCNFTFFFYSLAHL